MIETLKLYNYFRSSASYRVRMALYLKEIPFEYVSIHLVNNGGEQHRDAYRELNPAAEVPTIVHGIFTLSQSLPIIQYLDEVFSNRPLFPKHPKVRAKVLQFCETINAGSQPLQNLKVLKFLESEFGLPEASRNRWVTHWMTQNFAAVEKLLEQSAGAFCFGDSLTAADCFLIPQIFASTRFAVDLTPYPLVRKINETMMKCPDTALAHPLGQPDAPKPGD